MKLNLRMISRRAWSGFSLVEVVVTAALSSFLAAGAISVVIMVQRQTLESYRFNEIEKESRYISDMIAKDIRSATALEAAWDKYTAGNGTVILKVPSIDATENVINAGASFDRIIYRPKASGSQVLVREVMPGAGSTRKKTTETIGDMVKGSTFAGAFATQTDPLGANVIRYQFTASRKFRGKNYDLPIEGSVRLRNK